MIVIRNSKKETLCVVNVADCFMELAGADLHGLDLRDADLRGCCLLGVDLRDADLRGADLRDADLRGVDLRGCNLRGARLQGARLVLAKLTPGEYDNVLHNTDYSPRSENLLYRPSAEYVDESRDSANVLAKAVGVALFAVDGALSVVRNKAVRMEADRRAEAALVEAEETIKRAADAAQDGVAAWDEQAEALQAIQDLTHSRVDECD
jgi:hypothetical protein